MGSEPREEKEGGEEDGEEVEQMEGVCRRPRAGGDEEDEGSIGAAKAGRRERDRCI